jgi:hypothetical protein
VPIANRCMPFDVIIIALLHLQLINMHNILNLMNDGCSLYVEDWSDSHYATSDGI